MVPYSGELQTLGPENAVGLLDLRQILVGYPQQGHSSLVQLCWQFFASPTPMQMWETVRSDLPSLVSFMVCSF